MKTEEIKKSLLLASFLLQYPDEDFTHAAEEGHEILETELDQKLLPFFEYLTDKSLTELRENYVNTFDFGHHVNLYMTYSKDGDDRARGNSLIELKKIYFEEGLELSDTELPDYLPLMLEFAAVTPTTRGLDLLKKYLRRIEEMKASLVEIDSPYALILSHINDLMTQWRHEASEGVVS